MRDPDRRLIVGEIAGVYGVKGWVRIRSYTEPPENIFSYRPWQVEKQGHWSTYPVSEGRPHGKGFIASFPGVEDRDSAAELVGGKVAVFRRQLAPGGNDEIYWADLEGLEVRTLDGLLLGRVDHLIETGANDVLVVRGERERLIPYLRDQVIRDIDLQAGTLTVDWDADF